MSTQSDYQAKTWILSFLLRVHSLVIDGCRIHTSLVQSTAAVQTHGAVISPAVKLCGPSKNKCVHCGGARGPQADRMEVLMSAKERKSNTGARTHTHKHTGRALELEATVNLLIHCCFQPISTCANTHTHTRFPV